MVSHFLSVLDRLADPALLQFVKHLQSRAQGEVGTHQCCDFADFGFVSNLTNFIVSTF